MAAPSGTTWGSIAGDYGRLGIYIGLSNTATHTTVTVSTWLWTKYSCYDSSNTYYYNNNASSATTNYGSINVNVPSTYDGGSGWNTGNQVKISQYSYKYERGKTDSTKYCAVKLSGVDRIGATMTHYRSYTIPALSSYDVYFMDNGGTGSPSTQKKYYGKELIIPNTTPTRYGYDFLGWGISSVDTTVDYLPGATYTDDSVTVRHLYAIWKKDIGLHYDDNGGNGSPSGSTATIYNEVTDYTFTISTTEPTRTGYDFLGWSLDNTTTTPTYQPGATITLTNTSVLYAVWRLKTYQISYNANGGIGAPSAQTKTYGVNLKLSTVEPTRSGYKFLGWGTSNTAEEPTYLSGGTFTTNANTTLYAVWEQLGIAYINVNGTFQAGKVWVNDNGTWMTGIIFVNDNGTWTQGGI